MDIADTPSPPDKPLRLDPPDGWERLAISVFIFFHFLAIQFWNAPLSFTQQIVATRIRPYMVTMGLDQNWGMFAPEPGHENFYMTARITYKNGQVKSLPIGRQDPLNNVSRLINERERKIVENLYDPNNGRPYYGQMASYMLRTHPSSPDNPPAKVELMRFWNPIPSPPAGVSRSPLTEWHHDTIYSMTVDPKALL